MGNKSLYIPLGKEEGKGFFQPKRRDFKSPLYLHHLIWKETPIQA